MGVPSEELMNMIKSQRDSATPNGIPDVPKGSGDMGISDPNSPPMAAPMSTPEPKMGNREAALINVSMAMDLLEQSLPAIGSESSEGKQILSAIRSMIGVLGVKKASTAELQPAEILQMLQSLPQAGGMSAESKAMMSAPAIPGMAPEGPAPALPMPPPTGGGAVPPGAPVPPPLPPPM
jgi:hypothetical protein